MLLHVLDGFDNAMNSPEFVAVLEVEGHCVIPHPPSMTGVHGCDHMWRVEGAGLRVASSCFAPCPDGSFRIKVYLSYYFLENLGALERCLVRICFA